MATMMAAGKLEGGAPGKPSRRRAGRLQAPRAGPPARRFRLSLCPQAGTADSPNSLYRGERRAGRGRRAGHAAASSVGLGRAGPAVCSGPASGGWRRRRRLGRGGAGRPAVPSGCAGAARPASAAPAARPALSVRSAARDSDRAAGQKTASSCFRFNSPLCSLPVALVLRERLPESSTSVAESGRAET